MFLFIENIFYARPWIGSGVTILSQTINHLLHFCDGVFVHWNARRSQKAFVRCDTNDIADGPDMWHTGLFICQRTRLVRVKLGVNHRLIHMLHAWSLNVLYCFVLYFIFNIMTAEILRKYFRSAHTHPRSQLAFVSICFHRVALC